jgi:hypothetical protein
VSVKDRWVGSHEQVLNILIACWCYEPSKPSSLPSIEGDFILTASLVALREKVGMDPWICQSSCCRLAQKPFFSGAMTLSSIVDDSLKVAICGMCEMRMVNGHMRTEREKCMTC